MIVLKLSLVSGRRTFFGRGNEIHYIGGTEILPAPLDTAEEQKMIHMLGTVNEETARSMLIERNLRLVVYIAKKFDNTGIGVEDLISIGTIGLIKAINTFNPAKKIKLATYASVSARPRHRMPYLCRGHGKQFHAFAGYYQAAY